MIKGLGCKLGGDLMKKAIITINLVPEADDTPDEDIEKDILNESKIPWSLKILK